MGRRRAKNAGSDEGAEAVGKRLFSLCEAAFYLGRSGWSMRHLIADGKITIVRNGRRIFLARRDLGSFIEKNKVSYN